jgi:prepilin-type N-terminal cleavage/methylation domain-containing protein
MNTKFSLSRLLKNSSSSSGFTLVELLVAIVLAGLVAAGAGTGLVQVIEVSAKSDLETQRRIELNRASDFMAEEIKMASTIETDASSVTFTPKSGTSNVQQILAINLPSSMGVPEPIVYYIATPPSGSVWSGDRVVYRYGPEFDTSGVYTGTISNKLLIDSIDDSSPSGAACPSGWTSNPSDLTNAKGFYSCVASDNKVAEIYLLGESEGAARARVVTRSN